MIVKAERSLTSIVSQANEVPQSMKIFCLNYRLDLIQWWNGDGVNRTQEQ